MSVEPPSKATEVLRGIAGSPGVAIGKVVVFGQSRVQCPRRTIGPGEIDAEVARFEEAVARAQRDLREMSLRLTERSAEASILEAYVLMTGDPVLAEAVRHQIQKEKRAAEWAVAEASDVIAKRLAALDDPYLSERSHDVLFIGDRILRAFGTTVPEQQNLRLEGPSIVVAHDLSPADTAAMINQPVVGFVTEVGTRTSHTAIMARALEIPAVVGVTDALKRISSGDLVVVDGLRGSVLVGPQPRELDEARARGERHTALSRELSVSRDREATTQDGVRVTLRANVELPAEAILARDHGAEGIGLYRTEFLYIDRSLPPTEDQQFEIFRAVVETMRPMPVTLRTFDIGGDKFMSSLKLPPEMNPMLGLRAVRLALSQPEVFLEHLRAMVRASAYGEVKIMIPMIASLSELRQVRVLLEKAIEQVKARGLPCADEIPLGIMVEVPAAAVLVDLFAQEASFMSLGTNDLVQYTLAVDRTSRSLAYLASSFDPAILRLIRSVVRAGEGWACPVSICGAMASDPLAAVLLVGLGMRDFSMEAAAIPEIKEALRRVTLVEAEAVAREALRFGTSDEVEHCVAEAFAPRLYDLLTGER
ncbi:phosphoenolpyruvate--protein phosphotransferase [Polyangium mundeleinium]|uniref:Phosphoenolpyruvate-protein phosphotransferase n=1 Tax=Polyangium mundeleinium TaxID=2995306 RepID=A0ABT5F0P2_9BACT|nr:phosphoenolpyruvate--protein phosphotransferase [Polyangium mundeleinium]MDC0747647.1 phosphoenolpyruvate--protein phosphotransferase [Polyangium mundeleinium]